MTARVTIQAPTHHAVRVTLIDLVSDEQTLAVVEPGETRDFHVWDTRSLRVDEGEPVAAPVAVPG